MSKAIHKYKNNPSIIAINKNCKYTNTFTFKAITPDDILNITKNLDTSKATSPRSIPSCIFKDNIDLYYKLVTDIFNSSIYNNIFSDHLKLADVTPAYKKDATTDKCNYRPISLLPTVSKIFEKIYVAQIADYMEIHLSKYLCGFRQGHSTQHCLLVMLEKLKRALDEKGSCGALFTDLSKAFDCMRHDLLIAKLHAYNFDASALKLINSYLTNRKQRTKINAKFSSWSDIIHGVPQGSILGPLLFNIYINDIFFLIKNTSIANYADDNTPYTTGTDIETVIQLLETDTNKLYRWYRDNCMKPNADKSRLLLSINDKNISIIIDQEKIINSTEEKLLGITLDNDFSCQTHVSKICKKVSKKLHALARVCNFMNLQKRRNIMKAFIESEFSYCPLIWMFHGNRTLNNRINTLHARALRLVYNDNTSNFEELLIKDGSVNIHQRNLQKLATEVYKFKHNLLPPIMHDIFTNTQHPYNLRNDAIIESRNAHSVYNGTETVTFLAQKTWNLLPINIKKANTLTEFKLPVM